MSKREAEIIKKLVEVSKGEVQVFPATVKEVDLTTKTCTVETATGLELYDVRLKATVDESIDFIVTVPKIGSSALVGLVNNDLHALYLVQVSEPEKLLLNIGETKLEVDGTGIVINDGEDYLVRAGGLESVLNSMVSKLNDELSKISKGITAANGTYIVSEVSQFTKKDFMNEQIKH